MYKKRHKKGFGFKPDVTYIKETMNMSAYSKLEWLDQANKFINKALSKKELKLWEKFRRGDV